MMGGVFCLLYSGPVYGHSFLAQSRGAGGDGNFASTVVRLLFAGAGGRELGGLSGLHRAHSPRRRLPRFDVSSWTVCGTRAMHRPGPANFVQIMRTPSTTAPPVGLHGRFFAFDKAAHNQGTS